MTARGPNVIVITCHDAGRHFGCYGVPSVQTPAIDRLAAEGVRFTRMYATAAMCSPSRGSLLTGQYPARHGLIGLAGEKYQWELTDPKCHLSHVMRRHGYRTLLFGHQHETHNLSSLGFDYPNGDMPGSPAWQHGRAADERAKGVASFLLSDAAQSQPFYLQFGTMETHTPYDWEGCPPDDERGTWIPRSCLVDDDAPEAKELQRHIAGLQGSLQRLDRAVDIVLCALRDAGLEDNTLVLFSSDHGPELPRAKWTTYDAGTRIGFIMRWPGGNICGGETCDLLLSNTDFVPSLTEWLSMDLADDHILDGKSFARAMENSDAALDAVRDEVHGDFTYNLNYGVRTLTHSAGMSFKGWFVGREDPAPFLEVYDLERDPYEQHNVASSPDYAEVCQELEDRLWTRLEQTNDPVLHGDYGMPPYVGERPGERIEPIPIHQEALQRYQEWKDRKKKEAEV